MPEPEEQGPVYSTVACAFEGCTTLYVGKMDELEPTTPRGWYLSPKGEPWCPQHGDDEGEPQMTEYKFRANARQFLGGGAGPSGGATPNATSETHAIYKWVERNIRGYPGASISIHPATGQMVIGNYSTNYPVSMYDWVVQGEDGRFFVLGDSEFRALYGSLTGRQGRSLYGFDEAAQAQEEDEASKIFMLYSVDAWTGVKHFVSAHKTLDGAKRGVPAWALSYARECSCTFGEVANYGYFVILEGALLP